MEKRKRSKDDIGNPPSPSTRPFGSSPDLDFTPVASSPAADQYLINLWDRHALRLEILRQDTRDLKILEDIWSKMSAFKLERRTRTSAPSSHKTLNRQLILRVLPTYYLAITYRAAGLPEMIQTSALFSFCAQIILVRRPYSARSHTRLTLKGCPI